MKTLSSAGKGQRLMRIVVIGQAAFGEQVLQRLLERGEEVVGVAAPTALAGSRSDPLRALAEMRALPVFTTRDLKRDGTFEAYAALKPDLNIMAYVTDILVERVLYVPALGTIQYHPSLLPRHRGASAMNWAIIQGESQTGLTIFWPDKGIDTGPILLQKEVEIAPDDTLGSLYFSKLFPLGVGALVEAVGLVKAGKAPRIPQDESQATYEPICREGHAAIDWRKPPQAIHDLIRGCNPQPGAHTIFRGRRLRIFDCELRPGPVQGSQGEVVQTSQEGFVVALDDASLAVQQVQPEGGAKIKAAEFLAASELRQGERLGS